MLPTLDEFLTQTIQRNSYIVHSDFAYLYILYIRYSGYTWSLNNNLYSAKIIQIARVEAKKPGNGAFTKLIQHLLFNYKSVPILVECVLNRRFAVGLVRMGFVQITYDPSFIINHRHIEPFREGIKPGYTLLETTDNDHEIDQTPKNV